MNVLVIDVGGSSVKILATGQDEQRKLPSGPSLTPKQMVAAVKKVAGDWKYDAVSIGYPGPVLNNRPVSEPHNLGPGWMGFDFKAAFKRPRGKPVPFEEVENAFRGVAPPLADRVEENKQPHAGLPLDLREAAIDPRQHGG